MYVCMYVSNKKDKEEKIKQLKYAKVLPFQ